MGVKRVGGGAKEFFKTLPEAWVPLLPPDVEFQQKRTRGGGEGAARGGGVATFVWAARPLTVRGLDSSRLFPR